MSRDERVYRFLLRAYPPGFREIAGEELMQLFRDERARSRSGLRFWARMIMDLVLSAVPERLRLGRRRKPPSPEPSGRGGRMDSLLQDLRYAVRTLVRTPVFTTVAIATLALGIGANTAIFSLVNAVLLRPLPIEDPDRVVAFYTSDFSSGVWGRSSYPDVFDLEQQLSSLSGMAAFFEGVELNLGRGGEVDVLTGSVVSNDYFELLGVDARVGRTFDPSLSDRAVVDAMAVISESAWRRLFAADPGVIGRTINLNGAPITVIGVAQAGFHGTSVGVNVDVWLPLSAYGVAVPFLASRPVLDSRSTRWLRAVARLAPGATLETAKAELQSVWSALAAEYPASNVGTLQAPDEPRPVTLLPARQAATGSGSTWDAAVGRARLLLVAVALVLLIAAANVANLSLARVRHREREIAVRTALGAGRGRLIRQMLTESLVLSSIGGVAGVGLAFGLTQLLLPLGLATAIGSGFSAVDPPIDMTVLAFAAAVSLAVGLLFGIVPAIRASRPDLVGSLKDTGESSGGRTRLGFRDLMVVIQVAASLVLLVGAGLFVRSLQEAYSLDLGFTTEGVLLVTLEPRRAGLRGEATARYYGDLTEAVAALPGVRAAAVAGTVPLDGGWARTTVAVEGYQPAAGEDMELNFNPVTARYFDVLDIALLYGRGIDRNDLADSHPVAVVNQTFIERFWPGEAGLGRRITVGEREFEVVGVVADSKYHAVDEPPLPYVYLPMAQQPVGSALLAIETDAAPASVLPSVRRASANLLPGMRILGSQTLEDRLSSSLSQARTTAVLVGALGLLALLIAAVGVYGVMSYSVAQRTREIGIRSALGADRQRLIGLVLGRSLLLTVMGVAIGVAGAVPLSKLLRQHLFMVSPVDPITYVAVPAALAAVALLASCGPALRATRVEPTEALRYE